MPGTGERALTARLAELFPTDAVRVPLGIGDDAAIVRHARRRGVVACDPVVAGVHFDPDTPPRLVGKKAVDRNLSDLAAMGATADHLVSSVLIPRGTARREVLELFRGIRDAAAKADCLVVGGDVGSTPGPLTVVVTVLGHLESRALTRAGAQVGDLVHVTGALGGAWSSGRHLRFRPRLAEGAWLARQRGVHGAIDVSDGLLIDLWTLLRASEVPGAELDAAAIPIAPAARAAAVQTGRPALDHALGDGEDHELVFTVAPRATLATGGPLTARARRPIGRLTGTRGLVLVHRDGSREKVDPKGWQHDVG